MLILLVVGLLIVVGGGVFLLTSGGDDDESSQDDTSSTTAAGDQGGSGPGAEDGGDGGDGGPAPAGGDSPEETVERYIAATGEGDCEALIYLVTDTMLRGMSREMALEECARQAEQSTGGDEVFGSLEVRTAPEPEDGVATVIADAEIPGQGPLMVTFTLVDEGNGWLIDNIN